MVAVLAAMFGRLHCLISCNIPKTECGQIHFYYLIVLLFSCDSTDKKTMYICVYSINRYYTVVWLQCVAAAAAAGVVAGDLW